MSKVTDMFQAWHDDGDDDVHAIASVSNEIAEDMAEKYDLDLNYAYQAKLEMLLNEIVRHSIDWDEIAENDRNAQEYDEARRAAIRY